MAAHFLVGLTLCCRLDSEVVRLWDLRRSETFVGDLVPPSLANFHLGYASSSFPQSSPSHGSLFFFSSSSPSAPCSLSGSESNCPSSLHALPRKFYFFSPEDAATAATREVVTVSAMSFRLRERRTLHPCMQSCGPSVCLKAKSGERRKEVEGCVEEQRRLEQLIMRSRGILATKNFLLSVHCSLDDKREKKTGHGGGPQSTLAGGAVHQW